MLKIRLTRRGKKNSAFFRVVVAEHTSPIKGKFLENLGFLNPHTKEKEFKSDRIKYWIEKGAQCSDTVHNLLVSNNVIKGSKRAVKIKKKLVDEKKEAEAEKKSEEIAEVKPEEKEVEKPAEVKEPSTAEAMAGKEKKEEKAEDVKPEPDKKEDEKKESQEGKK